MSHIILHIPHSSRAIPTDLRSDFALSDGELENELLSMTDAWTDELVASAFVTSQRIIFPVSRLVIDPERFPNDADEPMAAKGMGAAYTKTSTGATLRQLTETSREALMQRFFYPHHRALTKAVQACLDANETCLIIDVHSFPSKPLPYELDQTSDRAEICIGYDAFHSPFSTDADVIAICERFGFSCAVNVPFAGSIVPTRFWNAEPRVRSFMIEVRRDLYMDERSGAKLPGFFVCAEKVRALLKSLAA